MTHWRCPYCLRPKRMDPEPVCCSETHGEPIPEDELKDYDEHDLRYPKSVREYD